MLSKINDELLNITMVTSIVGTVGSFYPSTTQWLSYIEQIEEFFLANNIKDKRKKVAIIDRRHLNHS